MEKIKALIFDVGGVLRLENPKFNHPHVHHLVAKKLGVNIDQYLDAIDTVYAKSIEGKISEEKSLKIMARNLKTSPKKLKSIYTDAYLKYYILNKRLFQFAFKKKKQGYKIAILSDQWWLAKKALLSNKIYNRFDVRVISCDVGVRKPNPKIYKITLKKLKLKPAQTVFIDNQSWNIKPAKKIGMKTVLFKNNKQAIKAIEKILGK